MSRPSPAVKETIPIGADHAGFALKERLKVELEKLGYGVEDVGPSSDASVDYPDFAHQVADRVERGRARRGVLMCGTGLGMSYADLSKRGREIIERRSP